MSLSYFRKSELKKDEVIANLKEAAEKKGIQVIGQVELPEEGGVVFMICRPEWIHDVLKKDRTLVGLIPCSVLVREEEGVTVVGIGNPQLLGSVSHLHDLETVLASMDTELRSLINEAAKVGDQKPKHIRLYSTETCPYCKMEKEYLDSKGVKYEQIMVDKDQKAAEEMVRKTGQMGVPVTEVEFEDGEPEIMVGFDKARLGQLLGIKE